MRTAPFNVTGDITFPNLVGDIYARDVSFEQAHHELSSDTYYSTERISHKKHSFLLAKVAVTSAY